MYYSQSALILPAQLVIEARMRLGGGTGNASRGPAFVGFRYGPDKRKNSLYITTSEIFLLSDENVKGASASFATTDAMHTYRIVANTSTSRLVSRQLVRSRLSNGSRSRVTAAPRA